MKDEIKETINILYEFATNINSDYIYDAQGFDYPLISDCIEELLDYITNLQDRIKELEQINEEHRKINGKLREKNRRLQQLCNAYEKEHSESFEIWKNDRMKVNKAIRFVESMEYCGQEDYFYDEKAMDPCGNDNTFEQSKTKLLKILEGSDE